MNKDQRNERCNINKVADLIGSPGKFKGLEPEKKRKSHFKQAGIFSQENPFYMVEADSGNKWCKY